MHLSVFCLGLHSSVNKKLETYVLSPENKDLFSFFYMLVEMNIMIYNIYVMGRDDKDNIIGLQGHKIRSNYNLISSGYKPIKDTFNLKFKINT